MKAYTFTIVSLIVGGASFLWAVLPWQGVQDAFFAYIFFYGPCYVFTFALIVFVILTRRQWASLGLLVVAPVIYNFGGQMLLKWNVESDWPSLVSSLLSAYAFLIACRLLIFRRCAWSVLFAWGALAVLAGVPFLNPVFKISDGPLRRLSFWGLHLFLWYVTVGHTIDRMAISENSTRKSRA